MLDPMARRIVDPVLTVLGGKLTAIGVSANRITWIGFGLGLAAALAVASQAYLLGLILFGCNRLADGLDGAVARAAQKTDLGGYLDIVLDFLVYSAMVLAFAVADPEANALASALLLFSFIGTGTTFLAFAIFAEKRGLKDTGDSPRALYYLGGLTEGSETIIAFVLFCLFPAQFALLATVFAAMCLITTASRIGFALHALKKQ